MKKLRCIIVEDEPLAAEILAEYIGMSPALEFVAHCPDALHALDIINKNQVDVVFLDIELPKISGLDFIKTLRKQPKVVITSAYPDYAVESFDLSVVDYLLKPIDFERFSQAVSKLIHAPSTPALVQRKTNGVRPYYFFTVNKRSVKIYLDEILFIESLKDSVCIHTTLQQYCTHYQLGELEQWMDGGNFLRIHRSFMVAIDKVQSFSAAEVEINGRTLPIGRSHKQMVMERLGK